MNDILIHDGDDDMEEISEPEHRLAPQENIAVNFVDALHEIHTIITANGKRKKKEVTEKDIERAIELVAGELSAMLKGTGDEILFLRIAQRFGEKLDLIDEITVPKNPIETVYGTE